MSFLVISLSLPVNFSGILMDFPGNPGDFHDIPLDLLGILLDFPGIAVVFAGEDFRDIPMEFPGNQWIFLTFQWI